MQGIFGNIELALQSNLAPEVRDYLDAAKRSATDAASRIRQLQRFSRKGKGRNVNEHLNVNSILDDVISQARPLWKDASEKAGIVITIEKKYTEKELKVNANAGELRSLLYNLIKNSVQAMPEGGRLAFETGKAENGVYVTVTDTGTGMDEATKTKIFQPFFTTKGFEQGIGLGMSTSYAIVKEHGGEIYVKESVPGKGTSIEIMLPTSKRKKNRLADTVSEYGGSARVLWVDDDERIRNAGKAQLERLNHSADTAAGGKEALYLLQKNPYDLMITDIGMPNMSGWQLAKIIKGNYPDMKMAVVTGWEADISNEEKEKYGVGYVFGKPIDMEQLKHMVGEVLQLKQK